MSAECKVTQLRSLFSAWNCLFGWSRTFSDIWSFKDLLLKLFKLIYWAWLVILCQLAYWTWFPLYCIYKSQYNEYTLLDIFILYKVNTTQSLMAYYLIFMCYVGRIISWPIFLMLYHDINLLLYHCIVYNIVLWCFEWFYAASYAVPIYIWF